MKFPRVKNKKPSINKVEANANKVGLLTKAVSASQSENALETEFRKYFLQDTCSPIRSKSTAYVRDEHHEKIMVLLQTVHKGKLSLSGYIDNVLTQHFQAYGGVMEKMYQDALSKRDCKFKVTTKL